MPSSWKSAQGKKNISGNCFCCVSHEIARNKAAAAPTTDMQPPETAAEPSALEARAKPKKKPPNARQEIHSVGGWKKGAPEWEGFGEQKKVNQRKLGSCVEIKNLAKSNIF